MHILHAEHRAEPKDVVRTPGSIVETEQPCTGAVVEAASTNEERIGRIDKAGNIGIPSTCFI